MDFNLHPIARTSCFLHLVGLLSFWQLVTLLRKVRSRNFLLGGCFSPRFCLNSEPPKQGNGAKMVFVVHGAALLVNGQIKTVAGGVLRVLIPPA